MLNAKRTQFNVKIETDHGDIRQRGKIRRGQDAWKVSKMAAYYGPGCNLWPAFVRLWFGSRRAQGGSFDFDPVPRTQEKTTAGFPVHRERPLSRTVASSDSSLWSWSFGHALYPLPGMQRDPRSEEQT